MTNPRPLDEPPKFGPPGEYRTMTENHDWKEQNRTDADEKTGCARCGAEALLYRRGDGSIQGAILYPGKKRESCGGGVGKGMFFLARPKDQELIQVEGWFFRKIRTYERGDATGESPWEKSEPIAWNSLLEELQGYGMTATALTNEWQLSRESERMSHAVEWWTNRCLQGHSRIFTIEQDQNPIATGEIIMEDEEWKVAQVRGPRNTNVCQEAWNLMKDVAREYTRRSRNSSHS